MGDLLKTVQMTSLLVIIHRDTTNVLASVLELTSQASLARTKILAISKNHRKLGISPNRKFL